MRVVHVLRRYAPLVGGTETYVRDLAEAQVRRGHDVTVVTLDHDVTGVFDGRLVPAEERGGVRVVRLPGVGARRFAVTSRPFRLVRELRRADIVHLHDIRFMTGLTCLASRLGGRPVIVHTHGLIFHTSFAARLKRFLFKTYYGPIMRVCRATMVASSGPDRDIVVELAPYLARRIRLFDNGIQLDWLLDLPRRPQAGSVLAFGRVARSKSIDLLLQALARDPGATWQLTLAGTEEPEERARLSQLAESLGIGDRLRWFGSYEEESLAELLATADLAVFPSTGEGFGLALLEAMAAGVPVLANDIPAHRALLGGGLADRIVDFGRTETLCQAIERAIEQPSEAKDALGAEERIRAREFGVDRLVADVESLYESFRLR